MPIEKIQQMNLILHLFPKLLFHTLQNDSLYSRCECIEHFAVDVLRNTVKKLLHCDFVHPMPRQVHYSCLIFHLEIIHVKREINEIYLPKMMTKCWK